MKNQKYFYQPELYTTIIFWIYTIIIALMGFVMWLELAVLTVWSFVFWGLALLLLILVFTRDVLMIDGKKWTFRRINPKKTQSIHLTDIEKVKIEKHRVFFYLKEEKKPFEIVLFDQTRTILEMNLKNDGVLIEK